jgi:hypothetical protein
MRRNLSILHPDWESLVNDPLCECARRARIVDHGIVEIAPFAAAARRR